MLQPPPIRRLGHGKPRLGAYRSREVRCAGIGSNEQVAAGYGRGSVKEGVRPGVEVAQRLDRRTLIQLIEPGVFLKTDEPDPGNRAQGIHAHGKRKESLGHAIAPLPDKADLEPFNPNPLAPCTTRSGLGLR